MILQPSYAIPFFCNLLSEVFNIGKLVLFLKIYPYTMAGYKRLSNAYELALLAERKGLKGAFVECGVWKGGTIAAMAFVARKSNRSIWLFDSFEGLPEPTKADGEIAKIYSDKKDSGRLVSVQKCVGSLEDVQKIFFSMLHLPKENIWFSKGWFQDTLPQKKVDVGPIAILRLDADWYESTKCVLDNLYDNVVQGGYVIIDDYGHWEGCKKAVDEFMNQRGIQSELKKIDYTGVYFIKP